MSKKYFLMFKGFIIGACISLMYHLHSWPVGCIFILIWMFLDAWKDILTYYDEEDSV